MSLGLIDISDPNQRNVLSKFGQGAFYAFGTTATVLAHNVAEIVTVDTEGVDVCSWFTGNVFTPKQAGYYLLFGQATMMNANNANFNNGTDHLALYLRKNGTVIGPTAYTGQKHSTLTCVVIAEANGTTDYFDLWALTDLGGAGQTAELTQASFGGVFVSYNNP